MNALLLFLAAAPAAQAPAAPAPDPLAPLYYLIGSMVVLQLGGMVFGGIRWLMGRTVQREDDDKRALKASVEALQKKYDERFEELDDQINDFDKSISGMQSELKVVRDTLESIRGGIAEIRQGLDHRFEKQAEFYRGTVKDFLMQVEKKLEELEFKLRQDMTRAVADHLRTRRK